MDTGDCSPKILEEIEKAIELAEKMFNKPIVEVSSVNSNNNLQLSMDLGEEEVIDLHEFTYTPFLQLIEENLEEKYVVKNIPCFSFGCGIEWKELGYEAKKGDPVALIPHFGVCSNSSILALASIYNGKKTNLFQFYKVIENSLPVFHISTKWTEQVVQTCNNLINGIFVIHSEEIFSSKNISEILNNTNIAGASAIAGPNSIILIQLKDRIFWYRGVCYPGLIDKIPEFAVDVTDTLNNKSIQSYAEKHLDRIKWKRVYERNSQLIFWKDQLYSMEDIKKVFKQLDIQEISIFNDQVNDVLTQIQIILDPESLEKFVKEISNALLDCISSNKEILSISEEVRVLFSKREDPNSLQKIKHLVAKSRGIKNKMKKVLDPVIQKLGQMVSYKGSSKRTFNLKQIQRKMAVYNNVQKALEMSFEDKLNMLEENCSIMGLVLCKINPEKFKDAIESASRGKYCEFASENIKLSQIDERTQYLDSCTVGSIMEISYSDQNSQNHLLYSKDCFAIPQGSSYGQTENSFLPIPLLDEFINLKDPSTINWAEKSTSECVAIFSVLTRGTITNSFSNRELSVKPQAPDIGYLMIDVLLSTMESLSKMFSSRPKWDKDFDNTSCQLMRGLFCQLLCYLGAGVKPLTLAFQMVSRTPRVDVPKDEELWIYKRMCEMFNYTCWSKKYLTQNIKTLVTKYLRKRLTHKFLRPMINMYQKYLQDDPSSQNRNSELQFVRLAIDLIKYFHDNPNLQNDKAIPFVERLFENKTDFKVKKGRSTERILK